ncbi:MAG TPA: PEGA domain-containing protein [Polyangia bacterium]|nr:PEGA domain-containing protein [Polyangia bacterium]
MLTGGIHVRAGAVVCAVLALTRPAMADDAREADKLIRHGVELRKAHDDESAAREFQKAYDLTHSPRAAGQLGLAEQALGRWEDAEHHVAEAIHAADDPWVAKNRAALDEAMGTIQAHLGRVEVIGDPPGADVSVNGRDVGKLPLSDAVRVSAGEVDIEVHVPGYVGAQRNVTIVGGQYQKVIIHLVKEAPPAAEPRPGNPEAPPAPTRSPDSGPAEGPTTTRLALKWGAAGLAGASLITGIVFTILHSQNVSSFTNHGCVIKGDTGVLADGMADPYCQSTLDTSKTYQDVFIAGYVAAGAFAATWLILQLTEPAALSGTAPPEQALRGPLCGPASSGFGLSCVVRF